MIRKFFLVIASFLTFSDFSAVAAGTGSHAVFKSTDLGRSWVRSDAGIPEKSRINAFGSLGSTLFAGTDSGIYISQNEAQSWLPSTGLAMSSNRIVCLATLGLQVFAGSNGQGLLMSTDAGKSWALSDSFLSPSVRCLLVHQERIYAGTDDKGVFVSDDNGQTWVALVQNFPDNAQVFALSVVSDRVFAGLYSKGLYGWNEKEQIWTKVDPVSPLVLASINGVLIAGHNPGGLHWSADMGSSWTKGIASTTGQFTFDLLDGDGELSSEVPVWELAASYKLVIAGAAEGIYYSEDLGRTWTRARVGLPSESPGISFLLEKNFVLAGATIGSSDSRTNTNR